MSNRYRIVQYATRKRKSFAHNTIRRFWLPRLEEFKRANFDSKEEFFEDICWICGWTNQNIHTGKESSLERCHIVPICLDGQDSLENIVLLCSVCHQLLDAKIFNSCSHLWLKGDNQELTKKAQDIFKEFINTGGPKWSFLNLIPTFNKCLEKAKKEGYELGYEKAKDEASI